MELLAIERNAIIVIEGLSFIALDNTFSHRECENLSDAWPDSRQGAQ
jgi:hypothetical protein